MRQLIVTLTFLAFFCSTAFADGGLVWMRSSYDVSKTAERLEKVLVEKGITILMIEHVMKAIMSICDRIIVLHHGETISEGTPEEVSTSKQVIEVYLGE